MTKGTKIKKRTDEFKRKMVERMIAGEKVKDLAKEIGAVESLFYTWKKKYGGKPEKKEQKEKPSNVDMSGRIKDVTIYLRHAVAEMEKKKVKRGRYHVLVELALYTLVGE
jgi:transposase-like protein